MKHVIETAAAAIDIDNEAAPTINPEIIPATTTRFPRFLVTPYYFLNKYIKIHWLFIVLFTYTGIDKLRHIGKFRFNMVQSDLLRPYYKFISFALPISELIIAALLCYTVIRIGKRSINPRLIGMYASLLLMLLFTGYVTYALLTNDKIPCTCGGIISQMNWTQHLLFNIVFSALAFRAIYHYHYHKKRRTT